jgi:acyl CoA:acetate/3-ketoacid CoA transferase beta subunit
MAEPANLPEICIAACAEAWRGDGEILASGIGTIPRLAAGLARLTFEPELLITDGEARLIREPVALGGPASVEGWMPFQRVFDTLWSGRRHVMMGAAQIDRHGNTNIASIGPSWQQPKRQLLGMRGAPGNTISHPCSFWIGGHLKRVFVERVDVVSGLGYDPELWPEGVHRGSHEIRRVVTNLAVLDFEAPGPAMRVRSLHPGVSLEQVQAETGFELAAAPELGETPVPDAEALRIIREVLDPDRHRDREVRA